MASVSRLGSGISRYDLFLAGKEIASEDVGIHVERAALNRNLFPFQKEIVLWALRKGRVAIFCDCGLGKTIMQLAWAEKLGGKVLVLAPLAVGRQTEREGRKFGIACTYSRTPIDARITITNYEMLHHFNPRDYVGVVLDESSILKSFTGKFRTQLIDTFQVVPYRLACTATPAPNDNMELGNHSEFLGVLSRTEMLSTFFVHDGGEVQKWRLKRHAEHDFWKWMASWAVMLRRPSDLGYEDGDFVLPELIFHEEVVPSAPLKGRALVISARSLDERRTARLSSLSERVARVKQIIMERPQEPWLVWVNYNAEGDAMDGWKGFVQVSGSDTNEIKEQRMLDFCIQSTTRLVSKPRICGFGMNFQHCRNIVFLGLSDSYEQFYQAIRRCWRFGQKKKVHCYIVTSSLEGSVVDNVRRKEADANKMMEGISKHMNKLNRRAVKGEMFSARPKYEVETKEAKKKMDHA